MTSALNQKQIDALAESISKLQETLDSWVDAGIPRRTLIILLSHYTKVPQRTIRVVMEGMDALYDYYFTEDENDH
ncbi:MAG: hypothetical protein AMJ72_05385 [Acidithiobacillales bacterium SM1_46]|nr:MAG: hypothetical protein AMJ72_05385 [Acidithiobacillales bacterium SM1_46]